MGSLNSLRRASGLICFAVIAAYVPAAAQSTGPLLTYISGSSVKLEQVIGDCDWQIMAQKGTCAPTASKTVTRFNILGNGQGGSFEDNGRMIFLFGDTISANPSVVNYHGHDPVAWSTSTDPEAGLLLNFFTNSDGSPLFVLPPGLPMGPDDVPNSGISLSDGIYLVCNVGSDTGLNTPQANDHSVLVHFDETSHTFTAGRTISTLPGGHFVFTSLHASGTDVLMFGAGNYRASDIYLSTTPATTFASGAGTRYFAGLVNGQPTWTNLESGAVPVVQDNPLNGPAWPNDNPSAGNLSVVYSNDLGLWLMTYDGGRQSNKTRGIYFTYAQQPWGPWATPQLIFNDVRDNAYGVYVHNPNIVPDPPGDGLNGPVIGTLQGADPYATAGGTFAPLMIERFIRVAGDTLKIYYSLSTWNPYTVVRMRSEFSIRASNSDTMTFAFPDRGGFTRTSQGDSSSTLSGYADVQPNSGSTAPSGVAIFGLSQSSVLVSETGVPATAALTAGRIYAEMGGGVNAGLAIVNPNDSTATINFYFTDANGFPAGSGSMSLPAKQQIAKFLDQSPFKAYTTATFQGTFSFASSLPVAVVALRGFINERGEFLMSTLPVIDPTVSPSGGAIAVPHFADGGGWITQILLVNPTDHPMTGQVQFIDPNGVPLKVTIGQQTASSFTYSVPGRTSQKLVTAGTVQTVASGSVHIVPGDAGPAPTPLVLFSYKPAGVTVSEAGVPVTSGTAFRMYVESSGSGSVQTGLAVANTSSSSAKVTFELTDLNGTVISGMPPASATLAGSGQMAKFLGDIFPSLPNPFKGVLRITTTSTGLSVVGLRTRTNERQDFLITTIPATNENSLGTTSQMFFPQMADGGGYTTQFIVFSGIAGQPSSGDVKLVKQDGTSLTLALK